MLLSRHPGFIACVIGLLLSALGYVTISRPSKITDSAASPPVSHARGTRDTASAQLSPLPPSNAAGQSARSPAKPDTSAPHSSNSTPKHEFATIPEGEFRSDLMKLDPATRAAVLSKLNGLQIPAEDYGSLHVTYTGALFYTCNLDPKHNHRSRDDDFLKTTGSDRATTPEPSQAAPTATAGSNVPSENTYVPISAPPIRHSRPGSANVLYLDFNGHTITGTQWNSYYGISTYVALPYDKDGNVSTFSPSEQATIIEVWERVAEDFAPFDVNVTTEQPTTFTTTTGRAVITAKTDANGISMPRSDMGGVAYLDVFGANNYGYYSPAFVYNTYNAAEIAETVSHEFGHNLGLSHDGQPGTEYYSGHGIGATSWAPIMGSSIYANVTQWSKGEYALANNTQDDFAIISSHIAFRTDDASGDYSSAPSIPQNDCLIFQEGILGQYSDIDAHKFTTAAGLITLSASPWRSATGTRGGNADIKLELLNSSGEVIVSNDAANDTAALLASEVAAGTYYVRLTPMGTGTPLAWPPTGYTHYGSVGQYTITGTVVARPAILSQTTGAVRISRGQSTVLTVSALSADGTHTYQWKRNGRILDGATNATLSINSARLTDDGYYQVLVSNSLGTTSSAPIFVKVAPAASEVAAWGDNADGKTTVPAGLSGIVAVAAGSKHSLALRANGSVVAWGYNGSYQTSVPSGLTDVVDIAAGRYHSLALRANGSLIGWGSGTTATPPANLTQVVAVASETYTFSLFLNADGTLVGQGSTYPPPQLSGIVAISAGYDHSLALKGDGTVVAWGANTFGQITVPSGLDHVVAIDAGIEFSLALRADGTVVAWGRNSTGEATVPANLANVIAISAGAGYALALKADGTIAGWGNPAYATPPGGLQNVLAISTGGMHTLALVDTSGDTIPVISTSPASQIVTEGGSASLSVTAMGGSAPLAYQWRCNGAPLPGKIQPTLLLSGITPSQAGSYDVIVSNYLGNTTSNPALITVKPLPVINSFAPARQVLLPGQPLTFRVSASGTGAMTYQWYYNGQPVIGANGESYHPASVDMDRTGAYWVSVTDDVGTRQSSISYIAVAPVATRVLAWGNSGEASPPAGITNVIELASTSSHTLALRADGSVLAWGSNSDGQTTVPRNLKNVVGIAAGSFHSLALKDDGTVVAWGKNYYGESSVPPTLNKVISIAAGSNSSLALQSNGTIVHWGFGGSGSSKPPVGLTNVVSIKASSRNALALISTGTVVAWGANIYGEANVPTSLTGVRKIAAGGTHSLALKTDGTIVGWGSNGSGQRIAPAGLTGVVDIAGGSSHSLALKSDGTVVGWGNNSYGQISIPLGLTSGISIASGSYRSLALVADATTVVKFRSRYFTTAELTDTTISGDAADHDSDGLPNLIEYALNLSPLAADTAPATTVAPALIGGQPALALTSRRNRYATDLTYAVQTSPDLVNWTTVTPASSVTTHTDALTDSVTLTVPISVPRTFVRLKITVP